MQAGRLRYGGIFSSRQRVPRFNDWALVTDLRRDFREREGPLLNHILYEMKISGRAGLHLLESLHRDAGPTAYLFECLHCRRPHFHVDQP